MTPANPKPLCSFISPAGDLIFGCPMIADVNCRNRGDISIGHRSWTLRGRAARPFPSLPPVSLLASYRPTRLEECTDPNAAGIAHISRATTW